MEAQTTVASLIRVASQLIDLMNREIEALRAMRVAEVEALQAEKNALTTVYVESVRNLGADPHALTAVDQVMRREFTEVASRFQTVLANNERALYGARFAHDRLLKAVVEAVNEERTHFKSYSASGVPIGHTQTAQSSATPLALDTRL